MRWISRAATTRTLSISLYDQVQEMNYRAAGRTAWLLVALSFAGLLAVYTRGAGASRKALLD